MVRLLKASTFSILAPLFLFSSVLSGTDKLRALVLRPSALYGEEDPYIVPEVLKATKDNKGVLVRIDNIFTRCQFTYAGNAAWACLKAKERIQEDESIGGEEFFVTDDTPIVDPYDFLKPYIESHGFRLSKYTLPYWLVIMALSLLALLVRVIRPFYAINLSKRFNPSNVKFICKTYFFNRNKAILRLNYEPFYTPEESDKRSLMYYKSLVLK